MKRRISDLLDGCVDDTVNLEAATPLSSQRIKELTMSRIEKKTNPVKKGTRIISKILVAAAAISMLTVTAAAAEHVFGVSDWFRDILNAQAKEDVKLVQQEDLDITVRETVKENQLQKLEELGQAKNESVTSEGSTMTLTALYSDEYVMHLYFQLVAPEGTVLPDGPYAFTNHNNPMEVEGDSFVANMTMDVEALPDSDPTDNQKDFHVTILSSTYGIADSKISKLNDGIAKKFYVSGIYQRVVDEYGDEDGFHKAVPGEFTFDITNPVEVKRTAVDVSGTNYGGHTVRQWTHEGIEHSEYCAPYDENGVHTEEWDYSVTPAFLSIGPLSAEWRCDYTATNERVSYGLNFKIIMKDGTNPLWKDGGGMESDTASSGIMLFTNPIDLEEVDYILIGDESINSTHKVYLNP